MNSEEQQLSERIREAIAAIDRQTRAGMVPDIAGASVDTEAVQVVGREQDFLDLQKMKEQIKDMQSARSQRERYARWVFALVASWILALFIILIAQGACPAWRPFSDKVLITLVTSMTINLIGTLVIVLKYIFR
ncbi:hypothetical protein [Granulicella tundricola]|uniref:Transmembrane protein n=1 Tax=Granulicella tundricola (strain ATCC BAA-1859 / DSM 23138 / MP5ACTX9) TaxID=1198114 RepID=E8X4Z4_GRATM|nr:hypothetical protein [Granulicella tundricola]ADW67186.1 hypothetical protein AciX9_0099 [Granulicella tundricola MP5ACTX9]